MPNVKLKLSKHAYRLSREALIFLNEWYEKIFRRREDYERVAEIGKYVIKHVPDFLIEYQIPDNLETEIFGLKFPSPLILASYEHDFGVIEKYLKLGLGGAIIKTAMREKRSGNPRPRLIREKKKYKIGDKIIKKECIINAMGLPGPGAVEMKEQLENSNLFSYGRPIGISIGGNSTEEYLDVYETFSPLEYEKQFREINATCPNTPSGQNLCKKPENLDKLLHKIRKIDDTPLFVKLSADFDRERNLELVDIIAGYENAGVTIGNTKTVECDKISVGKGGLSGPCIRDGNLKLVEAVNEHKLENGYDLPIMATGGLSSTEDVVKAKENGASLFGMATGIVQNMFVIPEINYGLSDK